MTAPALQEQAKIIYELFSNSFSPSQAARSAAEQQLEQYSKVAGFLPTLMSILMHSDTDHSVKQAGTIFLKNKILKRWKTPLQEEQESAAPWLTEDDMNFIKSHIIELYAHSSQFLRKILLPCFAKMIDEDYNTHWPSLVPSLFNLLNQGLANPPILMAGLDVMQKVVCARNTNSKNAHLPIYGTGFPMILSIAGSLLQSSHAGSTSFSDDQCWILKRIFKIYMSAIDYILAKEFQSPHFLQPWIQAFLYVIDLPLPAAVATLEPEEAVSSAFWKMKKWAYHAMNRLFLRYGNTTNEKYRTGSYSEFSKYFSNTFSVPVLNVYLKQVAKLSSGTPEGFLPDRLISSICDFLSACIQPKKLWAVLKTHYQDLVARFIFPRLCYDEEDEHLWEEDPHEYVRKRLDPYEDFESTTSACTHLLLEIVKKRKKEVLLPILSYMNDILSRYAMAKSTHQTPDVRSKDGVLYMIGTLASIILEAEAIGDQVETLVLTHVVPDLSSPNHFLRVRACWTIQHFEDLKYSSEANVMTVFRSVLQCLADPTLPVKIQAAVTLGTFLEFEEIRTMLTEHLPNVMSTLLDLTNETDLDSLSYVMEKLVTMFSDEMLPFAVQLATQLKITLMRLLMDPKLTGDLDTQANSCSGVQEDQDDETDRDYEAMADKLTTALGVMKTISTLIITVKSSPELIGKIEDILIEPIVYVLRSHVSDVYDETFDLIESLTFVRKAISPQMWQVFQLLCEVFNRDAMDYFGDMLPSLDNFISYGHAVILSSPPLLSMILNIIQTAMTNTHLGEMDRVAACQLMESMMLYCRSGIDTAIPVFLDLVLAADFPNYKSKISLVHHLEVILNALIYDARLTIPYLQSKEALVPAMSLWYKNMSSFTRVHDKKLMIMAVHTILAMPSNALPDKFQSGLEGLFGILKYALETLPAAVEERRKLEEAVGDEDEEDDDEGDAEDLSDFDDEDEDEAFEATHKDYQSGKFLNHLAKEHAIEEANDASEAGSDDFSNDSDSGWAEEELEEELFLETPLDSVDIYALLKSTLYNLPTTNPTIFQIYQSKLAEADKKSIAQCLSTGLVPPPKSPHAH